MYTEQNISEELKSISALIAGIPKVNVFDVPTGYFEGIEDELNARIITDSFADKSEIFSVPQGYFEGLQNSIMDKIRDEENEVQAELNALSPLIAKINKKNIFKVPQGYFDSLAFIPKEEAKLISMKSRPTIFRYAAAAVITGLLGLGLLNVFNNNSENVSSVPMQASVMKKANTIIAAGSFDKELNSVSDNDIESYLKQSGVDVKAAMVAASTDDVSSLPEETDYLINENTLDEFLKTKNLEN